MVNPNIKKEEDKNAVNQYLLETKFPMECEALPYEELEPKEQYIVTKCINHEELTNNEFQQLKTLLSKYRPTISKYNPNEIVENYKRSTKVIKTAQEFIDILDKEKRIHITLPVFEEIYEMEFILLPISDDDALKGLATELDLFKNYSEYEKQTYAKGQMGSTLTNEEKKIVNKISKELEEYLEENNEEVMIKLLAKQLKFPEDNPTYEKRLEYWSKFPINARITVFSQVMQLLGISDNKNFRVIPISH